MDYIIPSIGVGSMFGDVNDATSTFEGEVDGPNTTADSGGGAGSAPGSALSLAARGGGPAAFYLPSWLVVLGLVVFVVALSSEHR